MRIRWDDPATRAQYEDMVSVLIKRIHRDAERIDGSGGDGGRDVQVPTDDGLVIYELKSFTGRLRTGGRKSQIGKSLTKAAKLRPVKWFLVVPIDPTPDELAWLKGQIKDHGLEGGWLGQTWLDSEMAMRPDIQRYFLDGQSDEVINLLKELRSEELAVDDARQAVFRARAIRNRLNETDPYYEYALTIGNSPGGPPPGFAMSVQIGDDRIDVIPRYRTAHNDRPISVNVVFQFDKEDHEHRSALERALRYGEPAHLPAKVIKEMSIDAPAGLGEKSTGGELRIEAPLAEIEDAAFAHLTVLAPDRETRLVTQEFELTHRRMGQAGGTLRGADATGLLTLELLGDLETRRLNLNISFSQVPVLPAAGLAVARWLEQIRPPNLLELRYVGSSGPSGPPTPIDEPLVDVDFVAFYDAFLQVQERAGVSFPVPADLTQEEWEQIAVVAEWLDPEKRSFRWVELRVTVFVTDSPELRSLFTDNAGAIMMTQDVSLEFRSRELAIGKLARTFRARATVGPEALDEALAQGVKEMDVDLVPAGDDIGYEWLMSSDEVGEP